MTKAAWLYARASYRDGSCYWGNAGLIKPLREVAFDWLLHGPRHRIAT